RYGRMADAGNKAKKTCGVRQGHSIASGLRSVAQTRVATRTGTTLLERSGEALQRVYEGFSVDSGGLVQAWPSAISHARSSSKAKSKTLLPSGLVTMILYPPPAQKTFMVYLLIVRSTCMS